MNEGFYLTPLTRAEEIKSPILVFAGWTVIELYGIWVCFNCEQDLIDGTRVVVMSGPNTFVGSKRCPQCKEKMGFSAVAVKILRMNVEHVSSLNQGLYDRLKSASYEGSRVEHE